MATLTKNYLETGLSSAQVAANFVKFGPNEIKTKREFTALKILLSQFTSFLIVILIASGLISIYLNEMIDGIAILTIVLINAIIGFIQEYKAENAVKALKSLVVQTCVVIRDSTEKEIPIHDLVPEDIILLSEGEKIPADLEIIESFSLKADESILTGESIATEKKAATQVVRNLKTSSSSIPKSSLLFKGTIIVNGRGKAKVIGTGMNTEFGKIVNLLSKEEKTQSHLSAQLDHLGKQIGVITLTLIAIIFIIGYFKHISAYEMLFVSVSLGVSTIPEGMPIIVTLTLAVGVQLLAKKNAIARKMNAIETLGATTVICSDKTGTLTLNEMTVKKIFSNFKETTITGVGYDWTNKISLKTKEDEKLLEICENCNNSFVDKNIIGDPTEIALKILTRKADQAKSHKKLDEIAFTSDRKMMSTLHLINNKKYVFSKGAFEEILKKCSHISINGKIRTLTSKDKQLIEKTANSYAEEALRVLGFAYKESEGKFTEDKLIFVGLVGMIDPPRKEVANSIMIAQQAGIKIKIITGDNPITAKAIGKSVGLKITNVLTGDEIDKLNDAELLKLIYKTSIFARTKPEHKYRLVELLQKNNEVVAVTGDGVNDAPALKKADVGIAMGIKGTEATKEVADIILKDDNFSTIITTIEEGRRIYKNILSFIKYMLAANLNGVMIVGLVTIMGFPLPILPLQILWINLATDAFPALALGQSKAHKGLMKESPHPKEENMFKKFGDIIIVTVAIQTTLNLILYFYGLTEDSAMNIDTSILSIGSHARTLIFTEIVIFELFFAFVCKGKDNKNFFSYFSNGSLNLAVIFSLALQILIIYLPFAQTIFKTTPLSLKEWVIVTICSMSAFLIPIITEFLRKIFKK